MKRSGDATYHLQGQNLILTSEKAVFWNEKKTLILSDLHLGKSGHFRKNGLAIPESVNDDNLKRLDSLITSFSPETIIFVGDLFHSEKNSEWTNFKKWRMKYKTINMILTIGNHDFYPTSEYEQIGLACRAEVISPPFLFIHDPEQVSNREYYTISGHIHPSVRLKGKGRQSTRLACFYFKDKSALLPAFGSITGTHTIKPSVNETVFGIIESEVHQIS